MKIFTTLGDGIALLKPGERSIPEAKSGEIVVRMLAASLNYRDLLVVKGVESWKPLSPRIPVSDGVGGVVAVGERVPQWKVGDLVAGLFLPKWLDGGLQPHQRGVNWGSNLVCQAATSRPRLPPGSVDRWTALRELTRKKKIYAEISHV
jgi:NADPH:quinone reductase-like Zn-dependent oxidoreductase